MVQIDRWIELQNPDEVIGSEAGGDYALLEICCVGCGADASVGVFASAGASGHWSWPSGSRSWRSAILCIWILRICAVRLRSLRLLQSRLVRWRRVRRSGPMVSWPRLVGILGTDEWLVRSSVVRSCRLGTRLCGSGICWAWSGRWFPRWGSCTRRISRSGCVSRWRLPRRTPVNDEIRAASRQRLESKSTADHRGALTVCKLMIPRLEPAFYL